MDKSYSEIGVLWASGFDMGYAPLIPSDGHLGVKA